MKILFLLSFKFFQGKLITFPYGFAFLCTFALSAYLLFPRLIKGYKFSIDFNYWVFDSYISEELLAPKLKLERQLGLLQVASFATTIGILLLGFIIDFGERHKLKYFYILLIIFTAFWSTWYTIFPFIST